jgi:peptidoglycan hydrolase-like protein with peptidoglycan-binding domain
MHRKGYVFTAAAVLSVTLLTCPVYAAGNVLKEGMQGSVVTSLQKDLKKLGYFDNDITGYYGEVTAAAVKKLQKKYGYSQDGTAGEVTQALIDRLLGRNSGSASESTAGSTASASSSVLKVGMEGSAVTKLQKDLIKLGFLDSEPTGYYGEMTEAAVKKLQKKYGYSQDGAAGPRTLALIGRLTGQSSTQAKTEAAKSKPAASKTTTSKIANKGKYMLTWREASKVFKVGKVATVYDIESGLSFKIKRTYGTNHADCETASASDTKIMKKVFGGDWSWDRRAVIISVDGYKIAASMAGMPHAGSEKAAANRVISSRSGGYGRGTNLDAVKGNSMSGHFDVHFLKSKTHGTNRVDKAHQNAVKQAAEWAKKKYGT